jgi:hypothetical protein
MTFPANDLLVRYREDQQHQLHAVFNIQLSVNACQVGTDGGHPAFHHDGDLLILTIAQNEFYHARLPSGQAHGLGQSFPPPGRKREGFQMRLFHRSIGGNSRQS